VRVPTYPKIPFSSATYENRTRRAALDGSCFVCSIVAGDLNGHVVLTRDDVCVSFLDKWPTLLGYALLAPLEHRTNVVADFTENEYADLQRRVYRLGQAIASVVPTERLYVVALGSAQGNSHVHWHIAPLPPGVPYAEQQCSALSKKNGYLDIPEDAQADLARSIQERLTKN
jgi:ATP adenylyltransferase